MNHHSDIDLRKRTLRKLLAVIERNEENIIKALYDDFRKPAFEAVVTETSYVVSDLKNTIRKLEKWARPERVWPSILNFPSSDFIYSEPYGNVLIIAPWNYPFQLAMSPLIAAVAAGNNVILKPSEMTPNTSSIIELIVAETFDAVHVEVLHGGPEVTQRLLTRRWDYIFFTGSIRVGKIVAEAAAKNLTPTTLELGGKNPCIVDETANLELAARRIVWGKFVNAGQTCIAPDYILAKKSIKERLIELLKIEIERAYGTNPMESKDYARIINTETLHRLENMMAGEKIAYGGIVDPKSNYVSPTIIDEPSTDSAVMEGEIFGPLLPVLSYNDDAELYRFIASYEKPLALYVFSENKPFAEKIIRRNSFGGGCINDTMIQIANNRLPFGGVGHSGTGAYHGKLGFDTFSHKKSVVKKATWLDIPLRYAPYEGKFTRIRQILKWL